MGINRFLEAFEGHTERLSRVRLIEYPFTVGRASDSGMVLASSRISRHHAEFTLVNGQLLLTDLNSTNGTFINRRRLRQSAPVRNGDILHFAELEFRLIEEVSADHDVTSSETMSGPVNLPQQFPLHTREFQELVLNRQVTGLIQPITDTQGRLHAYELLGRGCHPGLPESPGVLLALAESVGLAVQFSELLRHRGLALLERSGIHKPIFINTCPAELGDPQRLLADLENMRRLFPALNLVLEIHESAVTDLKQIADLRLSLNEMGIGLAYDDFGAGRARLLELVETPPDYLKFDYTMIHGLDSADSPRYRLLDTLNNLVHGMGIATLAECVETEQVAALCRRIGMDYFQGFLFGRPMPIPLADTGSDP